jgi:hypothetical protein
VDIARTELRSLTSDYTPSSTVHRAYYYNWFSHTSL